MTTTHIHRIHIRADRQSVWRALLDPAFTSRYFLGARYASPPAPGEPFITVLPDGAPLADGVFEVLEQPERLVQTWRLCNPTAGHEPPSRVEWLLEELGPCLTRVTVRHGDLAFSPLTWAWAGSTWRWVLDALKTLLETGAPMPLGATEPSPPSRADAPTGPAVSADPAAVAGDWHRAQAVEANNTAWGLLGAPSPEIALLLEAAYAAAYHWRRAAGATAANDARAAYLVAKAWVAAGDPTHALAAADSCLALCNAHGLGDFDLAYAHEARARALSLDGRTEQAERAWRQAFAVPITDREDREIVEADFADAPGHVRPAAR